MIEEILGVEKVHYSYFDSIPALVDVSLRIPKGKRFAIIGSNGSGKSTFLRILAGLLSPTEGSVQVTEGGVLRDAAWRRRWTGYLSPDLTLYEEFSPLENLTFFGRARGLPRDPGRDRGLLSRLGLGDRLHDPLGTLSTGLRQRAKLAFALQAEPRILLLDEPGSNLDKPGREAIAAAVAGFAARESLVVVATNDPLEFDLGTRTLDLA